MATYLDITQLPQNAVSGFKLRFRVTARLVTGAVDTAYFGALSFTSSDPDAVLPATYPFVGGEAGSKVFEVKFKNPGNQTLTVSDGTLTETSSPLVILRPPGWGFDDRGLLPYGDVVGRAGSSLSKALAISTRQVDVTVTNLVQDNSPFLPGDALNPETWTIQRLDSAAFLDVVSVSQTGPYTYRLLTLQPLGSVFVTHRVSSNTLVDIAGALLEGPVQVDFRGLLDSDVRSLPLAGNNTRDIANSQVPGIGYLAGTLMVSASGDYVLETGPRLVRKLIYRRYMSKKRDFFHLPNYGLGIRVKEPILAADMGALKVAMEAECLKESEVDSAKVSVTLDSDGTLTTITRARLKSGGVVEVPFNPSDSALVY